MRRRRHRRRARAGIGFAACVTPAKVVAGDPRPARLEQLCQQREGLVELQVLERLRREHGAVSPGVGVGVGQILEPAADHRHAREAAADVFRLEPVGRQRGGREAALSSSRVSPPMPQPTSSAGGRSVRRMLQQKLGVTLLGGGHLREAHVLGAAVGVVEVPVVQEPAGHELGQQSELSVVVRPLRLLPPPLEPERGRQMARVHDPSDHASQDRGCPQLTHVPSERIDVTVEPDPPDRAPACYATTSSAVAAAALPDHSSPSPPVSFTGSGGRVCKSTICW